MEPSEHSDECGLFERIQMPSTSTMIRKLSWIPRVPRAETELSDLNEELSGFLMVLGNDHRVRCLTRNRKQRPTQKKTSTDQSVDDSCTGVCWKCLFTLGMGTCTDPFVSNFESHRSSMTVTDGIPHHAFPADSLKCSSSVALIDVHGNVHVISLIAAIEHFNKSGGLLERRRLRLLLREFGHFPEKYRVTSCLAFWSPLFGETDWLPLFVFPFVKLFQSNVMHAFEVVATVLMNWCATWFEYFPNPPINILCMIENLLAHADPELYNHFVRNEITTEIYAWPLLQSAFSEIFTENEWLILWDTILCHPPGLFLALVVAYAVCARSPLLLVRDTDAFEILYSAPPDLQPDRLLASLIRMDGTRERSCQGSETKTIQFCPLTTPQYPIVTRYPKFIVDFHIRERERIREEEKEATVEDMRRRTQLLSNEEEN
ncbi:unnamed protein product [Echinostoma caproni]|uniref:Rab-GAP TBC domain-containing protein n=1 Tax=Echinostoma caproni TaxID=27848 RepID=A0A183AFG1_9TREM|nr:unnamed protein product [Echinostoma caproni]